MKPQRNVLFSSVTAIMLVLPLLIFSFSLPTQKAEAQTTTTTLTINSVTSVPWGKNIIVTGIFGNANGGSVITFDGTGAENLPDAITNADGSFTAQGPAPSTVATGWTVQAHFAGDSQYAKKDSAIKTYSTIAHKTTLTVTTAKSSVIWGQPNTFTATLTDTATGLPLQGMTVSFDGTGAISYPIIVTGSDGKARGTGNSPNSVATGWTYQAHFAGDSLYLNKDSIVKTYSTTKHVTSMTIAVSPSTVAADKTYKVSGVLKDSTLGAVLSSKTITFTADTPITIADKTTDAAGKYSADALQAPDDAGTYTIQTHFAGDSLYNAKDSAIRTLTVTAAGAPAAADPEESTT
jgi:hypothetical protein